MKDEKELVRRISLIEEDLENVEKKLEKLSQSLTVSENISEVASEKQPAENSKNTSKASSFLPDLDKKSNEIIIDEKLLRKMHV